MELRARDPNGFAGTDPAVVVISPGPLEALGANEYPLPSDNQREVEARWPLDIKRLLEGWHSIGYGVGDVVKNKAVSSDALRIKVDRTPPSLTDVKIPAFVAGTLVPISWTPTEPLETLHIYADGAEIAAIDGELDRAEVRLPDCREYELRLFGKDFAGNVGGSSTSSVVCDILPPQCDAFLEDARGARLYPPVVVNDQAEIKLVIQGTDIAGFDPDNPVTLSIHPGPQGVLGVNAYPLPVPGATRLHAVHPLNLPLLQEGLCGFAVTLTDSVDNTASEPSLVELMLDRTRPGVFALLLSFADGGAVMRPVGAADRLFVDVLGTDNIGFSENAVSLAIEPGPSRALGQNENEWDPGTPRLAVARFPLDPGQLVEGSHEIVAGLRDNAGNVADPVAPLKILVDHTPPRLTSVSVPRYLGSKQLRVGWTATEALRQVKVFLDGVLVADTPGQASSAQIELGGCDRDFTLQLVAIDRAGNSSERQTYTVTCDETLPELAFVSVPTIGTQTGITLRWRANEPLQAVEVLLDDAVTATLPGDVTADAVTLPECNRRYFVKVRGTDRAGNVGTSPATQVVCDNVRPTVNGSTAALIASREVTFRWGITERFGPVASLELYLGGSPSPSLSIEHPDEQGERVVEILGGCGRAYPWEVLVRDPAGNVGRDRGTFDCDWIAPTVSLLPSEYADEASMRHVYGPSSLTLTEETGEVTRRYDLTTETPRTVNKYWHRYYAGGPNMPTLHFALDDAGEVATPPERLSVRYRYFSKEGEAASWTLRRDWTPIAGHGASRSLELSPAVLDESILTSTRADWHLVQLEVSDEAEHTGPAELSFKINLMPLPVIVSGCALTPELTTVSLRENSLHSIYLHSSLPLMRAKVYWPVGTGARPSGPLSLRALGASARTLITQTRAKRCCESAWAWTFRPHLYDCALPANNYRPFPHDHLGEEGTLGRVHCGSGLFGADELHWRWSDCQPSCAWTANDPVDHFARAMVVEAMGQETVPKENGWAHLQPNTEYEVLLQGERLMVLRDGSFFTWPLEDGHYWYENSWVPHAHATEKRLLTLSNGEVIPQVYSQTFGTRQYVEEVELHVKSWVIEAADPLNATTPPTVFLMDDCGKDFIYRTNTTGEEVIAY